MQVSRIYDKSVVSDTIIKAVSMFRKSYCDRYLKLYLVTGAFRPDTGVGEIMYNTWNKYAFFTFV